MSVWLLTILAVVIYLGLLQRTLDRMRLSDRAALIIIAIFIVATWLPEVPIGLARINIGGTLVPLGLAIYLIGTAGTYREQVRGTAAIIVTAIGVLILDWLLPQEPGAMFIDPLYVYGLAAGVIGYLAGRSRRSAFVGGMMGVLLADVMILFMQLPLTSTYQLGGGVLDSSLIAGLIGVGAAEIFGEARELVAPDKPNKVAWLEDKRRQKYKNGKDPKH
jgi:membrane-associated HD superfamily phosphohydrolase